MKQQQQKEQIKKHLRILKNNISKESEETSLHLESLRNKISQSQQRKDHTSNLLRELEQNQYTMEKDKLILKNKLEHVNKEVQNLGFAKDRINNKNQ